MQLAVIADIHGQVTALEAVLADIDRQAIDDVICLGDVATLGPAPNAVVDILRQRGIPSVLGNHDAAILAPASAAALQLAPAVLPALDWCIEQLTPANVAYLEGLPIVREVALGPALRLGCFHGSPRSPIESLLATTPEPAVADALAGVDSSVLAGGHTHLQLVRSIGGRLLVNPGSVGCPFAAPASAERPPTVLPWAEYGVVRWEGGVLSVDLRRVPIDLAACRAMLARSTLPLRDWWLGQYAQAPD